MQNFVQASLSLLVCMSFRIEQICIHYQVFVCIDLVCIDFDFVYAWIMYILPYTFWRLILFFIK